MAEGDADIALIGLAVMGQNLILNMNDHGFKVVAYNRTTSKVDDFLNNEAKGTNVVGAHSLEEMVGKLKRPRRVMILVKAGAAVDAFIDKLVPLLEKGDIIIDGGNSEYQDSQRRTTALSEKGILFVGSGVSGGEEGARYGPSLMPGGNPAAWPAIKPIFQAICAKSGEEPCCDWVGEDGSGHFVKMVHNGIEYGDMQLICEAYHLMKDTLGMGNDEMSEIFNEWNQGELDSFLIEISTAILKYKDDKGEFLLEKITKSEANQHAVLLASVLDAFDENRKDARREKGLSGSKSRTDRIIRQQSQELHEIIHVQEQILKKQQEEQREREILEELFVESMTKINELQDDNVQKRLAKSMGGNAKHLQEAHFRSWREAMSIIRIERLQERLAEQKAALAAQRSKQTQKLLPF